MEPTSDAVPLLSGSSSEEEEVVNPGASGGSPGLTKGPESDFEAMMRDFLHGQQQREDRFIAALQGLEASFSRQNTSPQAAGPSKAAVSSPRLDLPTPAATSRQQRSVAQEHSSWSDQLLRFERIARTWRWPETEWACRLVPLLSGKALVAYTAMDEQQAHIYKNLGRTRLKVLYRRWIHPEQHSKEQIAELIILEQLLRVLPVDVRTWVKEHEPEDGLTAAQLALQYVNAQRWASTRLSGGDQRPAIAPPGRLVVPTTCRHLIMR